MDYIFIKMDAENLKDINKPNQPFLITGKILPKYENGSIRKTDGQRLIWK